MSDSSAQQLANSVLEALASLKQLIPHLQDHAVNLARQDERLVTIKSGVEKLEQEVYHGVNSQPSIVTRLATLANSIDDLTIEMNGVDNKVSFGMRDLHKKIEELKKDESDLEKMRTANRTMIIVAVISALSAIGIALIQILK